MIILGLASALSVLFIAPLLPSNGPSPLEKQLTTRSAILMFAVFGVAVAPLFEEVIFRGFLFKVLWEIGGSKLAVPGSAVLFAGTNAPQLGENWYAVLLIFLVGLILAVVRQRSNSVIPSFIIHTSYNGAIFVLFALGTLLQKSTR
jgi:membrane protease YdiL (CAAX protease family)